MYIRIIFVALTLLMGLSSLILGDQLIVIDPGHGGPGASKYAKYFKQNKYK